MIDTCPRVAMRMECPECGYPYSEAMVPLNLAVPHEGEITKAVAEDVGFACRKED